MEYKEYLRQNDEVLKKVDASLLSSFINGLDALRTRNRTLYILGNGGSAATASHAVADFSKTASSLGRIPLKTIAISEMVSLQTAYANDESFLVAMAETLRAYAAEGDALLIISVSGQSPNLLEAFKYAKDSGIQVFSIVGARGAELAGESDFGILLDSEDYQVVENAQLSLVHWIVKVLQ